VKFLAGAGGGDVENAPGLLRFSLAIDAINPLLGSAPAFALALQGSDQELGNLSRFAGFG
jgi:hypothetical protein